MPRVVQLPTRRKEESAVRPPVVQRQICTQRAPGTNGVTAQKSAPAGKAQSVRTPIQPPAPVAVGPNRGIRTRELEILQVLIDRMEVVDLRGRNPKPMLGLTKGEYEALQVGMQILQDTCKARQK